MRRFWASAAMVVASAVFSAHAADVAHGNALYHSICVSCHGDPPSGGPEFATSGAYIRNAINTVPAMQFMRNSFSDADLDDIYAWLQSLNARMPPPPPPPPPVVPNIPGPLSGVWYDPSESGWGVYFAQRNNVVFAAWYTYDGSGNPRWYSSICLLPAGVTGTAGTCTGQVLDTSGAQFFGVPFDTNRVSSLPAGNLQIAFQDADNASMTYSGVAGQGRTVPLKRFPLASGAAPAINYTDIWWGGPSESGWGMAITHQASLLFFAWYVYDNNARPTWYAALCSMEIGTACSTNVTRTTGPPFGPTFDTSQVRTVTVGTLNVNFTDANTAFLSYVVNGVSGSKTVFRLVF